MSRADRRLDPFEGPAVAVARHAAAVVIASGLRCLARLDISDLPLPPDVGRRPLLVTNHRSPLDYCAVVASCWSVRRWPSMFARDDFFHPPLARFALRTLGLIPASRGREASDGLRRAMRLLDDGRIVAIAAEGGLVRPEDRPDGVGRIRGGAGRLAQHGADVTVLTITGADAIWHPGARLPRFAAPWNRPTITIRACRLDIDPTWAASQTNAAIRAAMVDLVVHDSPTGRPVPDDRSTSDVIDARS